MLHLYCWIREKKRTATFIRNKYWREFTTFEATLQLLLKRSIYLLKEILRKFCYEETFNLLFQENRYCYWWTIMNQIRNINKQAERLFESLPHQDKNNKKFNQQNVIYVKSTINKINNKYRLMQILAL